PGVRRAPITGGDMKEMSAEVVRLAPGATLAESVPPGSDVYLFTLTGAIDVSGAGSKRRVEQDSFVTVQEGTALAVTNPDGAAATLVRVLAPPAGRGGTLGGFAGGVAVA